MPLNTPEEVLVSKLLKAAAPLDAKIVIDTLANRDLIPTGDRYHMMRVDVQEDATQYVLDNDADLTNTGWKKSLSSSSGYLGLFDPNTNVSGNVKDNNDDLFSAGDWGTVDDTGFWNFTTGDQSPDGGSDHVENLVKGERIIYNASSIWQVEQPTDLVFSVNAKQGVVVLDAADIGIDPIAGMIATQTQEGLEELKIITDGLGGGAIYKGAFDPANPPANPPTDGDTVNFGQGDFYIVSVAGDWNFTNGDQSPDGGGDNFHSLLVGEQIRFNINDAWDVIPTAATPPSGNDEEVQFNNAGAFGSSSIFKWDGSAISVGTVGGSQSLYRAGVIQMWNALGVKVITLAPSGNGGNLTLTNAAGTDIVIFNGEGESNAKFLGVGAIRLPRGTTAQRPTSLESALIRYNSDLDTFEGYDGSTWLDLAGGGGLTVAGTAEGAIQTRNAAGDDLAASDVVKVVGDAIRVGVIAADTLIQSTGISVGVGDGSGTLTQSGAEGVALILAEGDGGGGSTTQVQLGTNAGSAFFLKRGIILGDGAANANAQVAIISTTKGFLMPKLTTAERTTLGGLLGAGDAGMKVYDTDLVQEQSWNGTEWVGIGGGVSFETQVINHSVEGVLNIDFDAGVFAVVNLTANITTLTFTATDGKGQVLLVQDVVGSRTVSFSGLKSIDGAIPDYSVNASAESLIDVTIANSSVYVAGAGNMSVIA